jgi:hypothetical protein
MRSLASCAARRGSVILTVLLVVLVLGLVAGVIMRWALVEKRINHRHEVWTHARYGAEAVVEHGFAELRRRFTTRTSLPADSLAPDKEPLGLPDPAFFAGSRIDVSSLEIVGSFIPPFQWIFLDPNDPANRFDPLRGQTVLAREITVYGRATATDPMGGAPLVAYCYQRLQVRDSPLFANAIFYNMDLEIAPGARMDIYGTVHANLDLYLQSNNGLYFHDNVTSAGGLFWGRKAGSGQSTGSGAVELVNGAGNLVSLQHNGNWLNSGLADWRTFSANRWNGRVQTAAHGVEPRNPVGIRDYVPDNPNTPQNELINDARKLIDPPIKNNQTGIFKEEIEVQKFSVKAGLVIEVNAAGTVKAWKYVQDDAGQYTRKDGEFIRNYKREEVTLPSGLVTAHPSGNLYDQRRGAWIKTSDIDIGKLKQLIENPDPNHSGKHIGNFDPATDWNGVVYIESMNTSNTGVRLLNGGSIPSRGPEIGLTVATNNALYVQGNFNADGVIPATQELIRLPESTSEPPAALVADAITILSNAWNDANSDKAISNRVAADTEIAAAFLTGIVPTNKGNNNRYSGGVENLPRFLENWSGKKLGYRGSMVVLFESEIATEPWPSTGGVYNPPNRIWGFNKLFQEGVYPPGTPNTRTYRRTAFRDISKAEYDAAVAAAQTAP